MGNTHKDGFVIVASASMTRGETSIHMYECRARDTGADGSVRRAARSGGDPSPSLSYLSNLLNLPFASPGASPSGDEGVFHSRKHREARSDGIKGSVFLSLCKWVSFSQQNPATTITVSAPRLRQQFVLYNQTPQQITQNQYIYIPQGARGCKVSQQSTHPLFSTAAGVRARYVSGLPPDVACCPALSALWPSFERAT